MNQESLRVLVVEDDYFMAERLADEIRGFGDEVVGPFADIHQALGNAREAHIAILDVRIRDHQSFPVADLLISCDVPFVFLTGYDRELFPPRFRTQHIYLKPSHARPLLRDLHIQHAEASQRHDGMEAVVIRLIARARALLCDAGAAERLVEATLLRAIAETESGATSEQLAEWLLGLLEDEFRQRGLRSLQ
ncbi:response regulator receiver protein [Paracoccus ravus]|uniref:response regulator receiver protein n=1 Tax=Paracoccus ravus TaxID=2447760 RepID=UPI00106E6285|nr:response regulator receiver protein [Paracoccus ravus]